jgi:TonB-dependent receptor
MGHQGINASARRMLGGASLVALALAVGAAQAQTKPATAAAAAAAPTSVEEVVVTGTFRGSLEQALEVKRTATVSADSILAEDIGKFPDLNLSESIQRIPGVALQRDAGEGREISVRGLGPQFTRVRINGMEALSTTGTSDANGGVNRGRSFDFNVFASDLFNSITVSKTAQASVEEGSLGATVDLRTARPFDYKQFTLVASGQGAYNDLAETWNPRGALLIADSTADGTFGGLLSVAYNRRDTKDVGTSTVRWATGNAFSPGFRSALAGSGVTLAQADAAFHPRFPRFDDYTDHEDRFGATASLQWRPTSKSLVTFDALYADFRATREERYLEAPSFSVAGACTAATTANGSCGIAQTDVVSASIDSTNTLTKGVFNNVDLRVEDRFDKLDTKFSQFTLNASHEFNDQWRADLLAGHARSDFTNPVQTTLTLDQFNVQGYGYDYTQGRVPLLSYGSANLTNPSSWVLTQIRERPQTALNTYDNVQANVYFKPLEVVELTAGVDWKKYGFETTEKRRSNGTTANQESVIPAAIAATPLSTYSQVTSLNTSGLGAPAGTVTNWLVPNLAVASSLLSLYDQTAYNGAFHLGPEPALGNNNSVDEEDTGGFVQADWHTTLFGLPFRGNVGVRYVKTDQTAKGYTFVSGAPVAITASRDYSDTLPSINMVLEPHENFLVRFSAAKAMARPNLGSLTPSTTVSVSGSSHTVTAGNPNLDPFRGKAYDLSFEWYFSKGSLISVALFRKDIDTFVQTKQIISTFHNNAFGIPDSVAIAACGNQVGCDVTNTPWTFTVPVNTPGGPLNGFEINYQQQFTFLPSFLSHTGALINYTSVDSSIQYVNGSGVVVATNDLTGLSRHSYNATLYYEDDKISTRLSAAYRSKYLTRVPGQEAGTDVDGTNSTFNLDFSFQYTWNEHLKLTLEGINLTDEFQDQYNDSSNRVSFYHHTGRELLFGFRYSY